MNQLAASEVFKGMEGPQSYCLSAYEDDADDIQRLIDGVNIAQKIYPSAWKLVVVKGLLLHTQFPGIYPIINEIFNGHTYTLNVINAVTALARKRVGFSSK